MMRNIVLFVNGLGALLLLPFLSLISQSTSAYEDATHVLMTLRAVQMSKLGTADNLKSQLGIDTFLYSPTSLIAPFGTSYIDIGTEVRQRKIDGRAGAFDESFFPKEPAFGFVAERDRYLLHAWLMRGARREDDTPLIPFLSNDDPVNAIRPLNHFFDPVHNLPLTIGGQLSGTWLGKKSPDWAIGALDAFADSNARDDLRKNHFAVFDAREAMWRALTLRDGSFAPVASVAGIPDGEPLRKAYWATTFRALGDLVHMIQDMGQPQHTRNEPHSGVGTIAMQQNYIGHRSVLESYIDARATAKSTYEVSGSGVVPIIVKDLAPIALASYPVPRFSRYTDYFSTTVAGSASASYAKTGYGLADYSNRRFFSPAKNFGHPDYQLPVSSASAYSRCKNPDGSDLISTRWDGTPNAGGLKAAALCAGIVSDELNPSQNASNVAITAESIWDQTLSDAGAAKTYHLTREVYDAQAALLIPRAAAYSAGIIDYFFRGQLFVAPPAEGVFGLVDHGDPASNCKDSCGFTKVKLRLANTTPDITPPGGSATPQTMNGGVVVAVAKFRRNSCYTTDLAGEYHGSGGDPEKIAYYANCVAPQPEEIVVSNPISVGAVNWCDPAVDPAAPTSCKNIATALTFTFQSPIPINAASLGLQVVYRGGLGLEADAVVVQTVDVSEPSFYVYMNASDYIKIGQSVYTRAEINAPTGSGLRSLVRPTTCIVNDQLSDTCLPPFDVSLPLRWGDPAPATVIAPLALGTPKVFSRFAMITAPDQAAVVNQSATPCYPAVPSIFPGRETQERFVQVPGSNPPTYQPTDAVSPMNLARGVYTTYGVACVVLGDGVPDAIDDRMSKMAPLAGAELSPKPIVGFTFGN
jgi:hypothetical protein